MAAGQYADAAACARSRGEHARAATLYERIWDHAAAAMCAESAGDLPRAVKNAVDSRDAALLARFLASAKQADAAVQKKVAAILEGRRKFAAAGELAELSGETERAADLYRRGHRDLDAARMLDALGDDREAGRLLERFIAHAEDGPERAEAELYRGLILARRMQHDAAARALQAAVREPTTRDRARRALIVELSALGLSEAARAVLTEARRDDPTIPATVDEVVMSHRPAPRPAKDSDRPLIAGRYRLGAMLGGGGTGRVHRATDEVTGREVAIKLLVHAPSERSAAYERFVREARIAAGLSHPNIVAVLDVSIDHGFMVMELLLGGSLADRIPPPLSEAQAKRVALEILAALETAHQHGAIHRDVKPANIFFDAHGTAKLGDFGIAHLTDFGVTQTGGLIGTLAYMAPEQITSAGITVATDIYALGVTLFQALTGVLPFAGPDYVAQHLGEVPPAPSSVSPDLSPAWDPIVTRMMAKNPASRYGSTAELAHAVAAIDVEGTNHPLILPARRPAPAPPPPAVATAETSAAPGRYRFETLIAETAGATLHRAVDSALERTVIIERWSAPLDARTEARLYALAQGGGPYLQHVLAYDAAAAVAVFEAPTGRTLADFLASAPPPGPPLPARAAVRLLKRLARAVAPIHERGHAHGALAIGTVVVDEQGRPMVLASGLGRAPADATCAGDVAALFAIAGHCLGLEPLPEALVRGIAPLLSGPERAVILAQTPVEHGEALYAFADALEIALLKAELRDRGSSP